MSRIDLLPESEISNRLSKLKADFEEIKTRQLIGADSVKNYRVFSDDEWDIIVPVTFNSLEEHTFNYRVTFTPETTTASSGAVYKLDYVYVPLPTVGTAFSVIDTSREKITTGNIQTWLLKYYFNSGNTAGAGVTFKIKLYFFATSPGTFGIVAI